MLSPLLWLSPVAQDVLSASSQLLRGAVPCPSTKLASALREADNGTCSGILSDAALCKELAEALESSGPKQISDGTAAELVGVFGKVLQKRSDAILAKAKEISKKLPKGMPSYGDVVKLLPAGEQPGEALRKDWLLWHSVGCSQNAKELPPPAADVASTRIGIAAYAGSGPIGNSVLALHVLEHLAKYQTWEESLGGNQPKAKSAGIKVPFDASLAKEVALRRVLVNALPAEVADAVATKVMKGEKVQAVLSAMADSTKGSAVMPLYTAPAAPKEPKAKEGDKKVQKEAGDKAGKPKVEAAGAIGDLHNSTATQELQWHLLAYRMRPCTTLGEAAKGGGIAASGHSEVPNGVCIETEKPKGFAGTWSPEGAALPAGHTPYSWHNEKALGMKEGFATIWSPIGTACPPGHTPYSWEKAIAASSKRTPSSASAKAPVPAGKAAPVGKDAVKPAAKPAAKQAASTPAPDAEGAEAALAKLDLRCGRIVECGRVPDADSLYLLKINVGDEQPRQVVSSLVKHYKEDELKDRQVFVYCNIKPGKMRGFESQAMVLAATSNKGEENEKCELLKPPKGAAEGQRPMCGKLEVGSLSEGVSVKNISKVWGQVQPLLQTNPNCEAMFDGTVLKMKEGPIKADTLTGVPVY